MKKYAPFLMLGLIYGLYNRLLRDGLTGPYFTAHARGPRRALTRPLLGLPRQDAVKKGHHDA